MPPSESLKKRKQSPSVGEPRTLLSFFDAKRPKHESFQANSNTALASAQPIGKHSEVIIISDDEDYTEDRSISISGEEILDLSFSGDEYDSKFDEPQLTMDESNHSPNPNNVDFGGHESPQCLGKQILTDSVALGSCSICGLLFLDATEKEVNGHVTQCLSNRDKTHDLPANKAESNSYGSTGVSEGLKVLNNLTSDKEELETRNAADVMGNSKHGAKILKPRGKEKPSGDRGNAKRKKPAPFYKVLPGMPIAVDAFCYGKIPEVTAYFLSHAHSDHYTSLSSSWKNGPIYCSETTGNLIKHMLKVDSKWVNSLPENKSVEIPDTGGVRVTLIDANHCPGSSIFVFSGRQTVDAGDSPTKSSFIGSAREFTYLHCGDFRACPAHILHPAIRGQRLDIVYLDTTYLNPKYCFPPQALIIEACAELAKQHIQGNKNERSLVLPPGVASKSGWFKPSPKMVAQVQPPAQPASVGGANQRMLVVVGTYTIGKERILKAIAETLSSKVYCNSKKHAIFMCQADPALHTLLTKDPANAQVHVLPLGQINIENLSEYLDLHRARYDRILGFRPTGWAFAPPAGQTMTPTIDQILAQACSHKHTAADLRPQRGSNSRVTIYGVPYSEHSSFRELTCFALSIDWSRMIATVNIGSAESRQKMQVWFDKWAKARRDRAGTMVEYRCDDYW